MDNIVVYFFKWWKRSNLWQKLKISILISSFLLLLTGFIYIYNLKHSYPDMEVLYDNLAPADSKIMVDKLTVMGINCKLIHYGKTLLVEKGAVLIAKLMLDEDYIPTEEEYGWHNLEDIPICKPAIYLYPETSTEVNIMLDRSIKVTTDIPTYRDDIGWNVQAYTDGTLKDQLPVFTDCSLINDSLIGLEYARKACENNVYPYIYWDGYSKIKPIPESDKGWIVQKADIEEFSNKKLEYIGFNEEEKKEFLYYWVYKVQLLKQDTVFIYFLQTRKLNKYLPMRITPGSDSINRLYIVVDTRLQSYNNLIPQKLEKFIRKGFTLVEWGGAVK